MAIWALMDEAIFPEGFMPKGGGENTKKEFFYAVSLQP
jgi:hypothetical protein